VHVLVYNFIKHATTKRCSCCKNTNTKLLLYSITPPTTPITWITWLHNGHGTNPCRTQRSPPRDDNVWQVKYVVYKYFAVWPQAGSEGKQSGLGVAVFAPVNPSLCPASNKLVPAVNVIHGFRGCAKKMSMLCDGKAVLCAHKLLTRFEG
jgi:hypothetical protein